MKKLQNLGKIEIIFEQKGFVGKEAKTSEKASIIRKLLLVLNIKENAKVYYLGSR